MDSLHIVENNYREPAGPKCKRCLKLHEAQDFAEAQPDEYDE